MGVPEISEDLKNKIRYSDKYFDDEWEYRHVILPKELSKLIPDRERLLSEEEWRGLGVTQSAGWWHYMWHKPEPNILMFKRERNYQEKYGNVPRSMIPQVANVGIRANDNRM